jgi:hypothetical protein
MPRAELVYFPGCPHIERARKALLSSGILGFNEISQSNLPLNHPYQGFSSPSIVVDGELLIGTASSSSACSLIDWGLTELELHKRFALRKGCEAELVQK